ncbi:hybrid sensor histidine kinase/response regulator [Paraburkholderia tropica]|uniref:histidine kinase n=1 Tax=Paraburkholderia tropica TaxID=92647 RepID=A0AAQ1GM31_9BURK|nr:hybrid sensor histidine kinase/response regulator [Paraburkholderia tropica]RQN35148.1 hybrid sensor histidine kinase/response regulator [Paraburkholderia tropica]SEK12127.1 Histidine kinase-, DNA gyrase B-, and HSP90-like ATPase [Paraburkholderia tropica]
MPDEFQIRPPVVLVVDDTASNLGIVVDFLEASGLQVSIARDGEEGLNRAELVRPDLILLDVMMPGLDGFEVCRRLKAQPETWEIPVIFMTSLSRADDKHRGFQVGAVDYVTKPLQMEELLARVQTHVKLRRLQQALQERNARLHEEIERRQVAQEALVEMINSVRNSSNAIAHDLRTPLSELRARMEVMIFELRKQVGTDTLERLEGALGDIDRVISIFNALLRLAEIDAGVRRSGFVSSNVADIVSEAVDFYQPLGDVRGIALSLTCPFELNAIVDPLLIAQAIGNLIDNGLKYACTRVHVSVNEREGVIEIEVADDGPGIPLCEREKVTERFYRGDASRGTPGVGLGLALVKSVATLHRGTLTLADNGGGLAVTLAVSSRPVYRLATSP